MFKRASSLGFLMVVAVFVPMVWADVPAVPRHNGQ